MVAQNPTERFIPFKKVVQVIRLEKNLSSNLSLCGFYSLVLTRVSGVMQVRNTSYHVERAKYLIQNFTPYEPSQDEY